MSIPNVYALSFYKANKKLNLKITNNSNSIIYNDKEYESLEALYQLGVTTYPTEPLLCYKGEVLTLYDETTGLYFDGRQNLNQWTEKNPTPYYNEPVILDSPLNVEIDNEIPIKTEEFAINHLLYNNAEQRQQETDYYDNRFLNFSETINNMDVIEIDLTTT